MIKAVHLVPATSVALPAFLQEVRDNSMASSIEVFSFSRSFSVDGQTIQSISPKELLLYIRAHKVKRLVIHSLQPSVFPHINLVSKKLPSVKMDWIYWGHNPISPTQLFLPTSMEFRLAEKMPRFVARFFARTRCGKSVIELLFAFHRKRVANAARNLSTLYHWSENDHRAICKNLCLDNLAFRFFRYSPYSVTDATSLELENILDVSAKSSIVMGHSANVRNNHLDILPYILPVVDHHALNLILPFSYGTTNDKYRQLILHEVQKYPNINCKFIGAFLDPPVYFGFLQQCAAYIAPGRGSLGAASLFRFSEKGGIPVADAQNATACYLQDAGCRVATYDSPEEIRTILPSVLNLRQKKNSEIMSRIFSTDLIKAGYINLFSGE
jgi:hypothetical protein